MPAWIRVTAIAAGSALAGGLAAAWFYRKAISRLQNAESGLIDSNFRIAEDPTHDDED